jgi:CheY-like chemotaxis protein
LLRVDDGTRAALTRLVRRDGYRDLSAASGAEGLDLPALDSVQAIISDQRMPEMSRSEFLSKVKQLYPDTVLTRPWGDDLPREQVRDTFRRYRPGKRLAWDLAGPRRDGP